MGTLSGSGHAIRIARLLTARSLTAFLARFGSSLWIVGKISARVFSTFLAGLRSFVPVGEAAWVVVSCIGHFRSPLHR